jgi:copper homeostasis protein
MAATTEFLVEACVDSVEAALAAQAAGVHRVELCADLLEGGCTPSAGVIQLARRWLQIRLHVIIRPRGGDFCYSDAEFEAMKLDVAFCKQAGADGVVIGILNPDGTVDRERTSELVALARPMSVTFHRAFDMTVDPYAALETLVELHVDRILTTGQEASTLEGLDLVADIVRQAAGRVIIMPGIPGGISERNLRRILDATGIREMHSYAGATAESRMAYRNPRVFMGGELRPPEYQLSVTDGERLRALVRATR